MVASRFCFRCLVLLALVFVSICQASQVVASADDRAQVVKAAVATVAPSVVRIRIIGSPAAKAATMSSQVTTGLVLTADGDVLTSAFGFSGASASVFVEDSAGKRVAAKIVATDHVRKLVLLRCESGTFQPVEVRETRWPAVGATAIAVGKFYPGTKASVSVGIVSAVRRVHGLAIQTDAKISPVNYGGPLVDTAGNVMGILVPLSPEDTDGISAGVEWYDSGIGFCIPLADAVNAAKKLRPGDDLVRGLMGVGLSTRNPLAEEVGILKVHPDSPADVAGLKQGDRIVQANGQDVTRLGIFQSIVKSSYAGDSLQLVVRREDANVDANLVLVGKLKQPEAGVLGVIVAGLVRKAGEQEDGGGDVIGIRVHVLPDLPAANAGMPETAILTGWGDETTTSIRDLASNLRSVNLKQDVKLTYLASQDSDAKTVSVTPVKRSAKVEQIPDSIVEKIAAVKEEQEWIRVEKSIAKDSAKFWYFAPKTSTESRPGLVVLLSATGTPPETLLKKWRSHCRRHHLILVVPGSSEGAGLTREHASLVSEALGVVAVDRPVDTRRVVLVAEEGQVPLCESLLLNTRLPQVRAAVYENCSPQASGITADFLSRKPLSMLIVAGSIRSRQAIALQQQAVAELSRAGVAIIQAANEEAETTSIESQISMWALNLRLR